MLQPPPSSQDKALTDEDFERIAADRRRARRRGLAWLFGGFALLLSLIVWGLVADEAPPDTSDLRVVFKHPPEDQNTYALLTKLVATLPPELERATAEGKQLQDMLSGDGAWDRDAAVAELSRYAPDLAGQVLHALAAPDSEAPELDSFFASLPEVGPIRHLSRILTLRAQLVWRDGDHSGAAELNLLTLRLGQRICQSRGYIIVTLTGTGIQSIALDSIRRHVDAPSIAPSVLKRYIEAIPAYETSIQDYHYAYKLEHHGVANLLLTSFGGDSSRLTGSPKVFLSSLAVAPGIYQPNRTIRWHADYMRAHLQQIEPTPPGTPNRPGEQLLAITEAPWPRRLQNYTGRKLLAIVAPALGRVTQTSHRSRANLRLTPLYAALRLHHLEHDGALPADLTALVPTYLPAIPLDPFGGAPLRYDRDLTTIWSIDEKHITITTADGDFPERGTPAFRLRFARPAVATESGDPADHPNSNATP